MNETAIMLTEAECRLAAQVGTMRQIENLMAGRQDAYGAATDNGWNLHIEGAAGELAFAKWANRYWSGNIGDLEADDVGSVQVRTRSRHTYDLILHPKDPDDRVFVLVTGSMPHYVLRGWIWARDGKKDCYWRDPAGGRPAFFVPQDSLKPMRKREVSA